jgi:hypothetical protein
VEPLLARRSGGGSAGREARGGFGWQAEGATPRVHAVSGIDVPGTIGAVVLSVRARHPLAIDRAAPDGHKIGHYPQSPVSND